MNMIDVKSKDNKFVVIFDKSLFKYKDLLKILENIEIEFLAKKVDFDKEILKLGDDIKHSWWEKNKDKILSKIES